LLTVIKIWCIIAIKNIKGKFCFLILKKIRIVRQQRRRVKMKKVLKALAVIAVLIVGLTIAGMRPVQVEASAVAGRELIVTFERTFIRTGDGS